MKERLKTITLASLVALSLVQSYMLAYSTPGTAVRTAQNYVNTEQMGPESRIEDVLFPEQLILHFGNGNHTVFNPGDLPFYNLIMSKLKGREFRGFQRMKHTALRWNEIRETNLGLELRLGSGLPVTLLSRMLQLDSSDDAFLKDTIEKIWIYRSGSEEVRTYFFSKDGSTVYEATQADLTVRDVEDDVGLGEFWTPYQPDAYGLYVPQQPIEAAQASIGYQAYSPDLLQRNLFRGTTRMIKDRDGSQVYTDGKRALQVEQNGRWISYTDPAVPFSEAGQTPSNPFGSMSSAVQFVNQYGGWDGQHQLTGLSGSTAGTLQGINGSPADSETDSGGEQHALLFRQYFRFGENRILPVVPTPDFRFGFIRLSVQQGVVTTYERSLIKLDSSPAHKSPRWLPGGAELEAALAGYARRAEIESLYPAVKANMAEDGRLYVVPVWAVRLADGTEEELGGALGEGFDGSSIPRQNLSAKTEEDAGNADGAETDSAETARNEAEDGLRHIEEG
ncbi:two-component system activity regulator YycH [Paenibacillus pasadenensis]|uniref:YycH family regulatory protein n=1 Tax=Paenibacillus pasadenensis TaxID=217090 RepID=UPI00203C0A35|nr:two-component system activity regulator YycH [Paenibacillus pasadenensis]MCM3747920.1 two-component system activity regulator YycH [Paenibacillus pasadenensis]